MRIVSLVPSLTATVVDLGLRDAIVGCTQFCVRPADLYKTTTIVGGTKDPDLEKIAALKPTHIIVNHEENKPEHIAACRKIARMIETMPKTVNDVVPMLMAMGEALGCEAAAEKMARTVHAGIHGPDRPRRFVGQRYLYLIWREPYMVAGPDTYIHSCMELLGGINACADTSTRYPTLSIADIKAAAPDLLLLSSEPYPFRKRDAQRLRDELGADAMPMRWIDGQLMSWYGSVTAEFLAAGDELTRLFE